MSDEQNKIVGVHVGTGGDPLILGLPVFALASVALGMGLIDKPAGLPVIAPIIICSTAVFQLITTFWAIILGQSLVAAIFGLFSGLWLSLGALLIGTHHDWFGIPEAELAGSKELFFIAYAIVFAFLIIPCLRLPVIYPLTVILIVVALALAAAGDYVIAGYFALAFSFLGFWAWLNVALTAVGAKGAPPLGKAIL
jgi:uncharacterized protein